MTIDAEKLADIAIDAAFDDYEGSGIFTKDRAKIAARKAVKAAMKPGYGGYGVGAFAVLGDGLHVYRMSHIESPLLPDAD